MMTESLLVQAPKTVLGIDPGLSGAVCKIGKGVFKILRDFKYLSEIATSISTLCSSGPTPDLACMELVHAFPEQGVTSTFHFGEAAGAAKAALTLSLPRGTAMTLVSPQKWQNFYREYFEMKRSEVFDSREIVCQLYPSHTGFFTRKLDHNSADAVLIATWGLRQILPMN